MLCRCFLLILRFLLKIFLYLKWNCSLFRVICGRSRGVIFLMFFVVNINIVLELLIFFVFFNVILGFCLDWICEIIVFLLCLLGVRILLESRVDVLKVWVEGIWGIVDLGLVYLRVRVMEGGVFCCIGLGMWNWGIWVEERSKGV